ncbi:nucleoside deaminase [Nitrococcus mobilis]|uniref:Guanine deaminase n=1 Tax=Nitrococcus mobilis Nb-231 TaxID=314278 RepID=A4BT15_9GAMM|nr:nucleoside deaminase [Nitrococcus mobilis]EAR21083.1 guanine deaminase [Nitrococcus mobilis Nb-231]
MDHAAFMRRAIDLSYEKMIAGIGGPFGAVIVHDGCVVAEGWNRVWSAMDPTAHAEVVAIRRACRILETYQLADCSIYTSCEPCPMCLGAIYWARLQVIYYANTRDDAAAIGFDDSFVYDELALPLNQRRIPTRRLLGNEAMAVFRVWQEKADKKLY